MILSLLAGHLSGLAPPLGVPLLSTLVFCAFCEHLGGGGILAGKCVYQTLNLCFVSCGMPPLPLHSREHNNLICMHIFVRGKQQKRILSSMLCVYMCTNWHVILSGGGEGEWDASFPSQLSALHILLALENKVGLGFHHLHNICVLPLP